MSRRTYGLKAAEPGANPRPTPPEEKALYRCDRCEREFASARALGVHKVRTHK